jgi:hypothetical protein
VSFYEAYYPETLGYIISINTPRIIETTFSSLLAPLASQATVIGLKAYGVNREEWSREVLKTIPPEQLTPEFGGNRLSWED